MLLASQDKAFDGTNHVKGVSVPAPGNQTAKFCSSFNQPPE